MLEKPLSKQPKGFTLIEILIATSILVMAGVAAIGVERNFMAGGSTQKHRLQATMLAQEGISAARAIFNSNLLSPTNPALPSAGDYCLSGNNLKAWSSCTTAEKTINQNGVDFTRTIKIPAP